MQQHEPRETHASPPLGNRRLVGQQNVRRSLEEAARSGRTGHAWLLSGPIGSGTTALALAFAEWLQGIDNLSDLRGEAGSKMSSWHAHPDIHLFLPITTDVAKSEASIASTLKERRALLAEDPYEVADLKRRPSLNSESQSNKRPFYPIDYMNKEIRKKGNLKPMIGPWVITIVTEVESFRVESANAFLKRLEEPPANHLFILTSHDPSSLLPTIRSRCQHVRLKGLTNREVEEALIRHDGKSPEEARILARAANGNYEEARTLDPTEIEQLQKQQVALLRACWTHDATALMQSVDQWNKSLNRDAQITLCQGLQRLLRDILIYRESPNRELLHYPEQESVIASMVDNLPDARFEEMLTQLDEAQTLLARNIQFKLIFTVLTIRFGYLLRGENPPIPETDPWRHLPAIRTSQSGLAQAE